MKKLVKKSLTAVLDKDLEILLKNLGVLHKYQEGKLKCKFCSIKITFDNLHSLFPQSGDIKFVCNKIECIEQLHTLLREGLINI